ncbi:ankyrin, partial [Lojkania enalia]
MAKYLLSLQEIDVNARTGTKAQHTPLMHAAEFGRTEVVSLLIQAGADLDLTNGRGEPALELAVCSRKLEAASLLIEHGASINFR